MKLVLLAIARIGEVREEEIRALTGLRPGSLERTMAKLEAAGLVDEIREVLSGDRRG